MAPNTRSAANSPVKQSSTIGATFTGTEVHEPRKIILIPSNLSPAARIVLLPDPRDRSKKRLLFCPIEGFFEFTRVATPPTEYRSILLASADEKESIKAFESHDDSADAGYINKDANILVATPFDPFFLLLPLLPSSWSTSSKILFQPLDDLLEASLSTDKHLQHVVHSGRSYIEERLQSFCDTLDAGDETMFRVNEEKAVRLIASKVERIVEMGLPSSLEERFVTRALEAPVLSVKREEALVSTLEQPTVRDEDEDTKSEGFDSQSTTASSTNSTVFSEVSIVSSATTIAPQSVSENIKHLQRLKISLDFIMASYMSPETSGKIRQRILDAKVLADFEPLHQHMKHLAELKAEALASRSFTDFSRKRGNADDDEAAEERAEKKRKLEEEEKRKKVGESRGVRDLKKVNVSGMKKMSDFFSKKPVATKVKS